MFCNELVLCFPIISNFVMLLASFSWHDFWVPLTKNHYIEESCMQHTIFQVLLIFCQTLGIICFRYWKVKFKYNFIKSCRLYENPNTWWIVQTDCDLFSFSIDFRLSASISAVVKFLVRYLYIQLPCETTLPVLLHQMKECQCLCWNQLEAVLMAVKSCLIVIKWNIW